MRNDEAFNDFYDFLREDFEDLDLDAMNKHGAVLYKENGKV